MYWSISMSSRNFVPSKTMLTSFAVNEFYILPVKREKKEMKAKQKQKQKQT